MSFTVQVPSTNEEEEAEFAKKHGRKSLKSAQEIQEKGDRRPSQDKTRGKMTGMVSAKRSARLRQSARSGPSKLRSERSWGSSNDDFEVVNFQEDEEEVFAAATGTTAAVAVVSEVEAKKDTKGGKAKTSKDKKATEMTQGSSEGKSDDGAQGNTEGEEKGAKKTAAAAAVTAAAGAGGALAAKKSEVPKRGGQQKKPPVAGKAQGSKLKQKMSEKKEVGKKYEATDPQNEEDIAKTEVNAVEGVQGGEEPQAGETGEGGTDAAEVAAIAAPAGAAAVASAAVVAASRVDHKQKDKAELRRLMVEKKQREKEEKLREKERLRIEKEEKLKKQKEEREARLKKEREEKKKAPIKKKYMSEASDLQQGEEAVSEEGTEIKAETETKTETEVNTKTETKTESAAEDASSTTAYAPKDREIAAVAAAAAAPIVVVAAVKGSKKSKEKDEEARPKSQESKDQSKEDADQFLKPVEESEEPEDAHEKSEEQESSMETTTTEDTDSGRDSSLGSSHSETASSTSAPAPVPETAPLPDGMAMRREQSIMLDLDRTQSQLAETSLRRENSDLATPIPGQSHRALDAVAEMMETARSQVEGRGLAEEGEELDDNEDMEVEANIHQPESLPVEASAAATAPQIVHPGLKENESKPKQAGAKTTKEVRSQTASEKQAPRGTKPTQVKQISVSEASPSTVPTTVVNNQQESDDSSSEESEQEDVMPVKKRPRAAGFMFPNENMAAQTFKTTGEVINAKPVKAKKKRRLPRKTSVDFLPDRTNLAFGLKPAQGKPGAKPGKVVPVIEKETVQTKKGAPKLLSVKELPAVRASAAPITIKDLTKKPPVAVQPVAPLNTLGVAADAVDGSASPSTRKGRSESSSPARRTPLSSRSHAVSRSHSDSRRGPPPLSHQTPESDETRFVKFREGVLQQLGDMDQQELNRILYPGIKRYPDTPEHLRRGVPAYKSLNALQRIHRKKYRQVAPEPHLELPPIMNAYRGNDVAEDDDPRMRNWLEELYSDKKFFDKSLARQEDDPFIQNRAEDGRNYLLNRARFWSTQQPLVRPGTKMGTRAAPGQPSSDTGGGSTPGLIQNNNRSKSDERRRDWKFS
ncbi:hypothetical protein ElyMa_006617600 [Elysia marginata]|uniref:Inner centromere protein ARK-binding domain-containing protein n=1 Tax=Elysia marginata TaxID=1093978 RepID=A0AAV4IJE8_9GAST|nr:hypothetical protein ElyMa_006617600 [Elysia marginata]